MRWRRPRWSCATREVLALPVLAAIAIGAVGCDRGGRDAPGAAPGGVPGDGPSAVAAADLVLRDGRIYTLAAQPTWAAALAVRDGEIVHVGDRAGADALIGVGTEVIELDGRLVLPGFHDLHLHVLEAGSNLDLCVLEPDGDLAGYELDVADCAREQRGEAWVRVAGMPLTVLDEEESPVDVLDRAVPDRPVLVLDDLGHAAFSNRRGLARAGVSEASPDPPGGIYHRDEVSGALTGALLENAQQVLRDAASPGADVLYEGLLIALEELALNGITSVSDAGGYWTRGHPELWLRALAEDELTVRAANAIYLDPSRPSAAQLEVFARHFRDDPESLLRFDTVKIYMDGILSLGTALLVDPYVDPVDPEQPKGFAYFEADALERDARALLRMGYRFHFHAVGDEAVRRALDLVETLEGGAGVDEGHRHGMHRTTHNYLVRPADLPRFRALDVAVDLQLGEESSSEEYVDSLRPDIGMRAEGLLPVRDLLEARAHVVLSSDWDADLLSPFGIIERALTRERQPLPDVATAVRLLTLSGAEALGHDHLVGSLEVGKLADLVVVDRDIFEIDPDDIGSARVLLTLLEGEELYRAPGL